MMMMMMMMRSVINYGYTYQNVLIYHKYLHVCLSSIVRLIKTEFTPTTVKTKLKVGLCLSPSDACIQAHMCLSAHWQAHTHWHTYMSGTQTANVSGQQGFLGGELQ